MRRLLVLLSGAVLLSACLCWGGTIYVKPDGTGDAPTIAAAMDSAAVGDTLVLASGTFKGEGNRDLAIPDKNLVIRSETGNADDCVIDCEGAFGFSFVCGTAVLKGLTLTNGVWSALRVRTPEYDDWIELTVKDCTFSRWEGDGGAINIYGDGEVTIRRCKFLSNVGGASGAVSICAFAYLDVLIDGCAFCHNTADYGAAITCTTMEGSTYISNSVFCHNSAEQGGGAIGLGEANPDIVGCTFFANSAPLGSAISGQMCWGCSHCILACGTGGCPIYADDPLGGAGTSCTNIYGNEGGDWVGVIADQLGQNGNFSACPGFCYWEMEPYDLHLCSASPCLPGNHPDGANCGLIGALGEGCACGPSATVPSTWGAIKAIYR
jgi:hypothetical protein